MANDTNPAIRFDDGAAYERMMGRWSGIVGERFLDWLAPRPGLRWLDVGCGNGAFTERIVARAAPRAVAAFDPSPAQIAYARTRLAADAPVAWGEADAMAMPVADADFDVAVMALVLFFVPEPARGVAEMVRAVRPGGVVAAYHWDMLGGGFPLAALGRELRAIGAAPSLPPSVDVSTLDASATLWRDAGLVEVETATFAVERTFDGFDAYWDAAQHSNTVRAQIAALDAATRSTLRERVAAALGAGAGPLTVPARANAVRGVKP